VAFLKDEEKLLIGEIDLRLPDLAESVYEIRRSSTNK